MIDSVSCHGKNCCAIVRIVNQLWKSGTHGSGIRFVKIHRSVKMSVQEAFVKIGHAFIRCILYMGDGNPTDQLQG